MRTEEMLVHLGPLQGLNKCARHRVRHLQSWIHQAQHVVTVTGLQANDVIDDIIHLGTESHLRSNLSLRSISCL